jgi:FAD/FMN-containing dehydrogenase
MYTLLDGCGGAPETSRDIFFLTTLDRAAAYVDLVNEIAAHNDYPSTKIGVYVQPQHQGVSNHVEFKLPFDPANEWEAAKVKSIYFEASDELIAQGAYFSRPYGYWSELIYQRDTTSTELLRIAKNIVDPENVMNPGKLCF